VVQYQQKTGQDSNLLLRVDGTANQWKDVREAVKVAKAREDGQDRESWSARDSCDKIVDNISAFETWLDLLPSGDYGSIVSGVFKMVVGVWVALFLIDQNLTILGCEARTRRPSNNFRGAGGCTLLGWTCE